MVTNGTTNRTFRLSPPTLAMLLAAFALFCHLGGCSSSPEDEPAAADFHDVAVTFHWTAVGDDALEGRAERYDLRYAQDSTDLQQNWSQTATVRNLPTPGPAGSPESLATQLRLETGHTYYFAIRAGDEAGNWSPSSNIIAYTPSDSTARQTAIDFNAGTN